MNTRVEKDYEFQAAFHYNGKFHANSYSITLSILVEECKNDNEPSIAMDRISYYLFNEIQNSILVSEEHTDVIKKYRKAGLRVCVLPDEPYDDLFAAVLIQKINAITEGRMKVTDVMIGSALSDGLRHNVVSEIAESSLSGNHWWNKSCLSVNDDECVRKEKSNVVQLFDNAAWTELGMSWKEASQK